MDLLLSKGGEEKGKREERGERLKSKEGGREEEVSPPKKIGVAPPMRSVVAL